MISSVLYAIERGFRYVTAHPHILLALMLLVGVPLVFLYSGQQFLRAAESNQDTLYRTQVGFLHDTLELLLLQTDQLNVAVLEPELKKLVETNNDLTGVLILKQTNDSDFIVIAGSSTTTPEKIEQITPMLEFAAVQDNTLIYPHEYSGGRVWLAVKLITNSDQVRYFIYSEHDLTNLDAVIKARKQNAYYSLAFVYLLMLLIAYWQIRSTDYRYLYAETKKANEMKDLFTNMIAHELRAPLTAIKGYASMVEESGQVHGQNKEYNSRIRTSAERLLTIVNDLLDVARIQSGKLKVENASTNIAPVLNAVRDELLSSAAEKGIEVILDVDESIQPAAHVDAKRLHQALTNLISNAIKYTKEGSITISLEEKQQVVELRIKDTGMGIAAEDQKKLFAPFFRVENDSVNEITGTGLGMWITKQLIELMGGSLAVESIKGVGTHVVVSLPKEAA